MTPEQFRQARSLLEWSQEELAARACVHVEAVRRLEDGKKGVRLLHRAYILFALAAAGVEMADDGNMQLKGKPALR